MSAVPPISSRFDAVIDAAAEPFRLGILGGTFDPVHLGHIIIADQAVDQFGLDGVLFIPTGQPVRKLGGVLSSAEERFTMLKLALAGNEHFDVSRIEIAREGITYTIDTLRTLSERYGDKAQLFFIVGEDSANDLPTWKDAEQIASMVTILRAKRRGGHALGDTSSDVPEGALGNAHGANLGGVPDSGVPDGGVNSSFTVFDIEAPCLDVSSHELRDRVRDGRSIHYLVPCSVNSYIAEQGLYL